MAKQLLYQTSVAFKQNIQLKHGFHEYREEDNFYVSPNVFRVKLIQGPSIMVQGINIFRDAHNIQNRNE